MPEQLRRRRWASTSLRGLMILILLVGGLMGWQARRASFQRRAVARIRALRGSIRYDWEGKNARGPEASPPGPAWLRRMLGDEYFQDIAVVDLPVDLMPLIRADESLDAYLAKYDRPLREDQLACLDGLDRLETFRLRQGQLKSEGMARLARLVRLKELALVVYPLDEQALSRLGELTALEDLSVCVKRGDDADLAFLDRLARLRKLRLMEGPVTDAGLARVGHRDQLEWLGVEDSELTDAGLAHLRGLKSLKSLHLHSAENLTDVGIAHLESLTGLWYLNLPDTTVTEAGLDHLRKLPQLKALWFRDGRIKPETIRSLKLARPDLMITLYPARPAPAPPIEKANP